MSANECWQLISLNLERIEGVTISGGEPFLQFSELCHLVDLIKSNSNLSVILFSGFTYDEIKKKHHINDLLSNIDVLIAGRYQHESRIANGLIGSRNKTIHIMSSKYTVSALKSVPQAEIIISSTGEIIASGINPLQNVQW